MLTWVKCVCIIQTFVILCLFSNGGFKGNYFHIESHKAPPFIPYLNSTCPDSRLRLVDMVSYIMHVLSSTLCQKETKSHEKGSLPICSIKVELRN